MPEYDLENMSLDQLDALAADDAPPTEPPATDPPPTKTPPPEEFFLKTQTGTVYNSKEDAVRGIEEKDRIVEHYRQTEIAKTGVDPLSGKKVREVEEPSRPGQQAEVDYAKDPQRYWQDLAVANTSRSPELFHKVQTKMISDYMRPYMPIFAQSAKTQAVTSVQAEDGDIGSFLASPEYSEYLKERPGLARTIQYAEADPSLAAHLQELYLLAHDGFLGSKGRKATRTAADNPPNPGVITNTTSATRPSLTSTTPTLPAPGTDTEQTMATAEGRAAIVQAGKQKGLDRVALPF